MDYYKEKSLDDYLLSVNLETTENILKRMKHSICKICTKNGKGTGFFCKIPFPDMQHLLTVLITNNHVINESYLNKKSKITISINNDNLLKVIEIGDRIVYTNEIYDITIIQIYQDEDNINEFLEIYDNFNKEGSNELYSHSSIYILHYPRGEKVAVSYGILKDIQLYDNYIFRHLCSTEKGSSGCPIISLLDSKVLGLHKGASKFNYNEGTFLKNPIQDFLINMKNNELINNYKNFFSLQFGPSKNKEIPKKTVLKLKKSNFKKLKLKINIDNNKSKNIKENNSPKTNKESNNEKKLPENKKKEDYNVLLKLIDNNKIGKITNNNAFSNININLNDNKTKENNKSISIDKSITEVPKDDNQLNNNKNINNNYNSQKTKLLNQTSMPTYDPNFNYSNSLINVKKSKEEIDNNFYTKKILPELLGLIKKEIFMKYKKIYENINIPLKNYSKNIMISINLVDADILRESYKVRECKEKISDIINKKEILKETEIEVIKKNKNKKMAKEIIMNNRLYNESIIDAASELIEGERFYGEEGEPLFWNKCRFLLCFKYDKKNPYKLIKFIFNSLLRILIKKYNDKNGIYIYKEELEKNKEKELNFEMEET